MIAVTRLESGNFFGERSLFGTEKRNASIHAKSAVELVVLGACRFKRVLKVGASPIQPWGMW